VAHFVSVIAVVGTQYNVQKNATNLNTEVSWGSAATHFRCGDWWVMLYTVLLKI